MKHKGTIWNLYAELYNSPNKWKYYSNFPENQFSIENILDNGNEAVRFIREYFQCGGKNSIVSDISNYCRPNRAVHSISTFFLGILLMPLFRPYLSNTNYSGNNDLYLWLWFLTCLYHDMAYKFENDISYIPSLNKFMSNRNIVHKIFGNKKIKLRGANKNTVRAYYNYRIKECKCVDHGIAGGVLLYNSLLKNYEEIYNCLPRHANYNYDDFTYNGLHFATWHFREFEKCANAIIQHNIWFQSTGEKEKYEKYKEYHLEDLTYESSNPPQYKDWLTALLVFCDSIEPLKRFPSCKPSSILKKIKLEFDEQNYELKISFTDTCMNTISYFKGVKDMQNWTKLSIEDKIDPICISSINSMYK